LSLAQVGIPSETVASLDLLSDLLDQRTPSAIIVDGSFVEHILELIAEAPEFRQHEIIVTGNIQSQAQRSAQQVGVKLLHWDDIAARGVGSQAEFARVGLSQARSPRRQNADTALEPGALLTVCFHRDVNNVSQT
jgi:long-chain acyl-CoA synthetase